MSDIYIPITHTVYDIDTSPATLSLRHRLKLEQTYGTKDHVKHFKENIELRKINQLLRSLRYRQS